MRSSHPAGSWEVEAEEKTLYGQVEEAVLSSLRPATVYQVRVSAENELGRSKEGRVLQVIWWWLWLWLFGFHQFKILKY